MDELAAINSCNFTEESQPETIITPDIWSIKSLATNLVAKFDRQLPHLLLLLPST